MNMLAFPVHSSMKSKRDSILAEEAPSRLQGAINSLFSTKKRCLNHKYDTSLMAAHRVAEMPEGTCSRSADGEYQTSSAGSALDVKPNHLKCCN